MHAARPHRTPGWVTRLAPLVVALVVALGASGAQAQFDFGSLLNALQPPPAPKPAATQNAGPSAAQNTAPTKVFPKAKSVPSALQEEATTFAVNAPAELQPFYERLYIEGERNAVLNLQRIGLAAMSIGKFELAEMALDQALLRIETIYADNAQAQKAKSLWTAEKVKDFKGEPYERAMAFFYRGLLYAAKGDFQNARAMFKSADYQDTVAESEQFAGDFGLMPFMAGWASYCDGDRGKAADYLKLAAKGDKAYADIDIEQPVLTLVEIGRVPFKYGAGKYGEALKFHPRTTGAQQVANACDAAAPSNCFAPQFFNGADLNFQATTRGGRPVDAILSGKVQFKEGAQAVAQAAAVMGDAFMQAGAQSGSRDAMNVGLLGGLVAIGSQIASSATQAQADTREWEQLPANVWVALSQTRGPAAASASVEAGGSPLSVALARIVNTERCELWWGRSVPPQGLLADAGPLEPGEHPNDPLFRGDMKVLFN